MAQHGGFNHFGGGHNNGGGVDPNDLAAMSSNQYVAASYSNNFNGNNSSNSFFDDDELLDTLPMGGEHPAHGGLQRLPMQAVYTNGYSNTPDGDPIQSPFVPGFNQGFRQSFGNSLASPVSYSGSPLAGSDLHDGNDPNYLNAKSQSYMSPAMQRKASNTRNSMTAKMPAAMSALTMSPRDSGNFGAQPIQAPSGHHEKSPSGGQWMNTPTSMVHSMGQSLNSNLGYSSFQQHGMPNVPISEMMKAGTSMPAKLGGPPNAVSTQEAKKKRRRESHNAVERRRRDNINERIQDLSKLVPSHRLEDEKIRKALANSNGVLPEGHATSGLAAPGARRATGAGTITTGLPIDDKEKGPNKGDILNGAVSWTKDLMWFVHLKILQHEELLQKVIELGGDHAPFEISDDERRMRIELEGLWEKTPPQEYLYSRTEASKLHIPNYTDIRGEPVNAPPFAPVGSISPGSNGADQPWEQEGDATFLVDSMEVEEDYEL
ncbi:hypothetical protein F5Y16DRAFT_275072 [Xylariaceae sp. FL0255]|nr:hypothetical protein F5Y16DRAFT_275072 [Xylariaceae sp. FL0255]